MYLFFGDQDPSFEALFEAFLMSASYHRQNFAGRHFTKSVNQTFKNFDQK